MRDEESLLAAIERPRQASFGQDFASPFEKATALMESIIRRRPFVDGNKRTATASAVYLLFTSSYEVQAEQKELEDFVVDVAEGALEFENIALWFEDHSTSV